MKPEPVFEAPWHAQVFALTVHLNEAGPQWEAAYLRTPHGAPVRLKEACVLG